MNVQRQIGLFVLAGLMTLFCGAQTAYSAEWWKKIPQGVRVISLQEAAHADTPWKTASGGFTVSEQAAPVGKILTASPKGLVLDSTTAYKGPQELRAFVRLRTDETPNSFAYFRLGRTGNPGTELDFYLLANRNSDTILCLPLQGGKYLHDLAALTEKMDWDCPFSNQFSYTLHAYNTIFPGWPDDYRARIENAMARLPNLNEKWLDVRIDLSAGLVRFWVDDRLVAQKSDPSITPEGTVRVELNAGAQIAGLRMTDLPLWPDNFLPVGISGYANGRTFMDNAFVLPSSLPAADSAVKVDNIPFVFSGINPEGNDHLDIGQSLYRDADSVGYFDPCDIRGWAGSAFRDPARIQIRIPNGLYDNLYAIAGSDNNPDAVPIITAMFYRPGSGFSESFEGKVPLATARSADARRLPVKLSDGRTVNLWLVKIPLDPAKLTSFSDLDIVEVELTKQIYQFRSYPDPIIYGWHQGGRPSAVHVYAVTLGLPPVTFRWSADRFGGVWTAPEAPEYTATITNSSGAMQTGTLTVATKSYDGTETTRQEKRVTVGKNASVEIRFSVPVRLNGYHEIAATLAMAGRKWTENRSFVRLAPDNRQGWWTNGQGALFGYWSYAGGHYTPKATYDHLLMYAAGARAFPGMGASAWDVAPQPWAAKDPYDPQEYAAYQKTVIDTISKRLANSAIWPDHTYLFPEPGISPRLTAGNYPEYWGDPSYTLTPEENQRVRMFFVTAKCAAEAIRKTWPSLKILIPYGDPLFIVPLLRAGFPKDLIDGSGLDVPGFERFPEQQLHQISVHRLYELKKEYEKAGIPNPQLQYCEGIFVPTEVGACSWQDQMDIYNRWTLISMAYGVNRFYSGWFVFDCGDYYGADHYGGCGIFRRIPYCDPKPAYAAYATMTAKLDRANFDGWIPTGSLTTYCLRFKGPRGYVYSLWTLRGKRPVTLTLNTDAPVTVTDVMDNATTIQSQNKKVTFETGPDVVYVTSPAAVASAAIGEPDNSDAKPAPGALQLANLGDGTWHYTSEQDTTYENNDFDTARSLGRFRGSVVTDTGFGPVFASKLDKQDRVRELMPWYNTLVPEKPIVLPGAPSAIGLWVKGASDWGRVVYCLRDAKGERWISIGSKDQWNCDDTHSWSSFNFDGWRYLRFELPGNTGYDNYRKYGSTWWRSEGGDGVVDLPLTLDKIIVEQRTNILYVNDVQPVSSDTVCFGKLFVEYASPKDATEEAVRLSRLRMPAPGRAVNLPNPIADMETAGTGAPTSIVRFEPPLDRNDGTTVHVYFQEIPGAKTYFVWCSSHKDGQVAMNMTPSGAANGVLVTGLRPEEPFYFWVTYQDAAGKMSKPSPVSETVLHDTFQEK
jgi:hypothetical protein